MRRSSNYNSISPTPDSDARNQRASRDLQLPKFAKAFDGDSFDPTLNRWKFCAEHRQVSLNFGSIDSLSTSFLMSFKFTLLWYAENGSADTMSNYFERMKHFLKQIKDTRGGDIEDIQASDILNFKASLRPDNAWYLSHIRPFLTKWSELQLPGVSRETILLFAHMSIPGNTEGKAVLTNDPYNGPLSDMEFEGVVSAENQDYLSGNIGLGDHLMTKLTTNFGPRPAQICLLKIKDFEFEVMDNGLKTYFINIPRIKQGGKTRSEFRRRPLIPTLGALFELHTKNLREGFRNDFDDPGEIPLFPSSKGSRRIASLKLHQTSKEVGRSIKAVLERLSVFSERTGKPLHITETRLRRTLGTRYADAGHGVIIIADALDHSTLDYARVYVESRANIVERIDAATAATLAPLARAFLGRVISTENEATRGSDPNSRINDPRFGGVQGSCGSKAFCRFNKPIACYTCPSFEAWRDGPHPQVLQSFIDQQNQLLSRGCERLARNLDRTIVACADVVRRITECPS